MAENEASKVEALQFPGLINAGRKYIAPHLRVGCTIYPNPLDNEPFVPSRGTGARRIDWDPRQAEASVISFNWSKTLGPPSGRWEMQIKPKFDDKGAERIQFDDLEIVDGDWIDVAILRNGVRIPLCRGVIDSVRKRTQSVGGATSIVYMLTGRDHGAFFEYPITWNSLWARTLSELASGLFTRRADGKVGGRPDEMFRLLIKGAFQGSNKPAGTPAGQWLVPQALADIAQVGKLYDLLKIITFGYSKGEKHLRGAYYNEPQLWTVGEQPLHQTLAQWINPLLNEFYYDLLPPKAFLPKHGMAGFLGAQSYKIADGVSLPTVSSDGSISAPLSVADPTTDVVFQFPQEYESENQEFGTIGAIIRERPFPNTVDKLESLWFHLPTWTVPTWLIQASDLGRSGHQRYNVFELLADFGLGSQQEQAAYAKPRWSKDGISTHGLRSFPNGNTRFTAVDKGGVGDWRKEREIWLKLLVDWFAPNPYLLQGSITVKVPLPEVRIGHRILIPVGHGSQSSVLQFYVEGVNISMQSPTQTAGVRGTTTLTLTRGFKGTDQELIRAVTDQSAQFTQVF